MTKATTARAAIALKVETVDTVTHVPMICAISLKGRGKAEREAAYHRIAPFAFVETQSRDEGIANLRVALGTKPAENDVTIAREEWVIGRVAAKLPATDVPDAKTDGARLNLARDLVLRYAMPVTEGAKATKLRAGKIGRRTPSQHKVIRAAEEAWSQIKAELGLGAAKTQGEKNKAKRQSNASHARTTDANKESAAPNHTQLVTPPKPETAEDANAFVMAQATTLLGYVNKHAGKMDAALASAVHTFKSACTKAMSDLALAKAEAMANAAEKKR